MIAVFKTSVASSLEIEKLKPQFDVLFQNIKWNFDLQDCDKILRVESTNEITKEVCTLLAVNGFYCEELTD